MGKGVIHLGRIALGLVAEIACRIPPLDRRFRIGTRLHGPFPEGPFLWMHGASMGECKMLLNLAAALQKDVPNLPKILITMQKPEVVLHLQSSLTQDVAGQNCGKLEVALAPADVPWTMKRFLRRVQPVGLILGENELWPGYLSGVKRFAKKPAVALVSGRFQKTVPGMDFSGLGFAAMQTSADLTRFQRFAARSFRGSFHEGGNWKLLKWARGAETTCGQPEISGQPAASVNPDVTSFISLHVEELPFLEKIMRQLIAQNKTVVLAPRRLEEIPQFESAFRRQNVPVVQWPATAPGHISLVHAFGRVRQILSRSESAFVGGSFHKSLGIHDFWEPLQMGVPTFVGPFCRGAESAVQNLVGQGALVRVPADGSWPQIPADRACGVASLSQEREKILNSYRQLKKFVEELLK